MTGLPRSIIKRYGVTKKAWAVYRSTSQSNKKPRTRNTTTRRVSPMAKRKRGFKRGSRSGFKSMLGGVVQTDAMLYGALRGPASSALAPVSNMLPLGEYRDEVTMALLSWAAAKYGSGIIASVGQKGLTVENARIGEALSAAALGGNKVSTGSPVLYG